MQPESLQLLVGSVAGLITDAAFLNVQWLAYWLLVVINSSNDSRPLAIPFSVL